MKKITIIALVIVVLVGACTMTLLYNKKKIDEKSKMDGNLKSIPVFVTAVKTSALKGDFSSDGTFSPVHEVTLMSEGQGEVKQILFNTGDFVATGQVLAYLDDEVLSSQLSLAQAALEKSRRDLKKYEDLLKDDAISSQQVEDARLGLKKAETDVTTLKKQVDNTTLKAPIQGTVTKKFIEKGSLVMPGTPVAEIVDISRLKFIANLAESDVVRVRKGDKVTITSSLFPGVSYQGTVISTGVKADESKRFPVEIEIVNNPSHPLKAGMFGVASFGSGVERQALTIPRNALVGSIRTPKVYIVEQGKAVLKEIRIGSSDDRDLEVVEGLKEGDLIVTSGQINLDNLTDVTVVNTK